MVDVIPRDDTVEGTPREVVTSTGPRSNISGAEVAQPYESLARGLDKMGEGLSSVAVQLGERAGAQAVTRDDQGNIQVEKNLPIFGNAGIAYSRALKIGALAEADGQAKRDDIGLREQFRDNPQGYAAAAQAYKEKLVKQYGAINPEIGVEVGRTVDQTTTMTYRGLLNEKERLDLQRADGAISAQMTSATDDATTLARQGVALNDPAMQSTLQKYDALQKEKLANPRLAYTPEQAALDNATFQSTIEANRFLHHIDETYKSGGFQAAEEAAKDIQTNPAYKLSEEKRDAYYHKAIGEIRANEAIRRNDIGEARGAFQELQMSSATGVKVDPDDVERVANAFRAANDPGGAARVYSTFARKPLNDDFGRQPISDQADQLRGLQGPARGNNPGNIEDGPFARGLPGYTGASGRFATFDTVDNGANAMAVTLRSYAHQGVGTLNELTAKWAPKGDGANDPIAYAKRIGDAIGVDPNARIDLADPAIAAKIIPVMAGVEQGHPVAGLGGAPNISGTNPANSAWLLANRQLEMDYGLWSDWKDVMKDYNEKQIRPNSEALNAILDGARATGNGALLSQISHDMGRIDLVQTELRKPLSQQNADITNLMAAGQGGALAPGQADVLKDLQTHNAAITKGLEENAMQTAVANFPDKLKTPDPLNFADPNSLVQGLKQRAQIAQFAAQNWQTEPLSVLDKQERLQAKAALMSPDPREKAGIYGAIATLPPDIRAATLRSIADKDPAGMAEAAAGSMMAEAPALAASIFQGQSLMKVDKRNNPEDEGNQSRAQFHADLDKSLPTSMFSVQDRSDPAGAAATTAAMVKARYAYLTAQGGSFDYDTSRLRQAVTDVTGGLVSHNGQDVVPPRRGMSQPEFEGVLRSITDDDLAGVKTLSGQPITADYLRTNGTLEMAGDGQYRVKLGRDPLAPVYAYQGSESPSTPLSKFILDLRNRSAAPSTFKQQDFTNPYGGGG